jgi:hypothetical protein
MERWPGGPFLISAAPGAGKTRPALEIARRLLETGRATRVVLVCPTTPLTRQWALAAGKLGLHLMPDADGPRPPRDFDGVAVTYARIASNPAAWAGACTPGTLVIADEAHHLGEELAWGDGFSAAFERAGRWLLLSGTPFRSDATPIPGVRYDREGVCVPDVSYSYAEAVKDGICRPVAFITYDGTLSWRSGDDVIEAGFDTVLTGREAGRRYRTAISTELPDGLPRILREAHGKLQAVRAEGHRMRAAWSSRPTGPTRARSPSCCTTSPARRRSSCCTPRSRPRGSSRRSPRARTSGSSRSTWSARASTSRDCASGSTRPRPRPR